MLRGVSRSAAFINMNDVTLQPGDTKATHRRCRSANMGAWNGVLVSGAVNVPRACNTAQVKSRR